MARSEEFTFEVKLFIIQELACFATQASVVKALKADYQLDVSAARIRYYDPTGKLGQGLAEDLKARFLEARKAFLENLPSIRLSNKAARIAMLDRMASLAEQRGQIPMVIACCEAVAKEMGGVHSNTQKIEHTGKNGGPIQVDDAARQRVFDRLDDLRKRIASRVDGLALTSGASRVPEGTG